MKRKIFAVLFLLLFAFAAMFCVVACDNGNGDEIGDDGENTAETYTITYTDENGTVKTKTVMKGEVSVSLDSALKQGYIFEGYSRLRE